MKIDFKNPESVRVLTRCCLMKDFNLDIELPPEKLLPTVPLRLNYLLWMEDLLKHAGIKGESITGIDIGCGASCIYCLLAVRMNSNWKMFALEIDEKNVKFARENILRNQLSDNVTVIVQEDNKSIFNKLFDQDSSPKTFCICNPPFFSSADEVVKSQNRTGKRKPPKSLNSGSSSELVFADGGELGFVKKILSESVQLQDKIEIFSTMLGCKKNLQKFLDELSAKSIKNWTTTEFVQGKTMRWGVAWSFQHDLLSFKDDVEILKKPSASHVVLKHQIKSSNYEDTVKTLKKLFNDLRIGIKVIKELTDQYHRWELTATSDTWSNQRRKRRAEQRQNGSATSAPIDVEQNLHIGLQLRKETESADLQMFFISGNMDKDCTNQIMQFIKNKLK